MSHHVTTDRHTGRFPVVPTQDVRDELTLFLPCEPRNGDDDERTTGPVEGRWIGQLRRVYRAQLHYWGIPQLADDAELLVSELATNGLRHGRGDRIRVQLLIAARLVVIEVDDGSSRRARVREAGAGDENGRGMFLVDAIAAAWGVSPDGTRTWCALTTPHAVRRAPR
ncbi:ATP-binding protein [Streptomyces sp. LE64]|uniref:ATP-binding protein n=1 Tax=Streptomyces sp. LE64 TaxID=3448653 RepID=UPI0040429438